MNEFEKRILDENETPLRSKEIDAFQVNVGYLCNQECVHCHLQAGPQRDEVMKWETMKAIIDKAKEAKVRTIGITAGAPEMNPNIRRFITELRKGCHHLPNFMEEGS